MLLLLFCSWWFTIKWALTAQQYNFSRWRFFSLTPIHIFFCVCVCIFYKSKHTLTIHFCCVVYVKQKYIYKCIWKYYNSTKKQYNNIFGLMWCCSMAVAHKLLTWVYRRIFRRDIIDHSTYKILKNKKQKKKKNYLFLHMHWRLK